MSSSHHGSEPEFMKRFLEQVEGRARRHYSEGRVGPTDDGDLAMAITADPERELVVIDFGKQVTWLGMGPDQAAQLGAMLIQKARQVSHKPLEIKL